MAKWRGLQARWDRSRAYGEGLTIITEAPGSRNEFGEWISGAETRTPITGATRPTGSGDLDEDTPAGATVENTRKFSVPLWLSPTTFDRKADRILYDEKEWRVLNAKRRGRPRVTTRVIAQVIEDRSVAPDPILGLTPAVLTLDRAMRRTVADLSGISREFVIPERDNGPRPQATYATVFETELVRGGIDGTTEFTEAEGSTTTLDARSQLPVAASYRIEFYRDGARGAARACWQRMVTEAGETTARLNGVVFGDIGELRHMDDVVADEYETREFFEAKVLYDSILMDQVDFFGATQIVIKVDTGAAISEDTLTYPAP